MSGGIFHIFRVGVCLCESYAVANSDLLRRRSKTKAIYYVFVLYAVFFRCEYVLYKLIMMFIRAKIRVYKVCGDCTLFHFVRGNFVVEILVRIMNIVFFFLFRIVLYFSVVFVSARNVNK